MTVQHPIQPIAHKDDRRAVVERLSTRFEKAQRNSDVAEMERLLHAVAHVGTAQGREVVFGAMQHPRLDVRAAAARAMASMGDDARPYAHGVVSFVLEELIGNRGAPIVDDRAAFFEAATAVLTNVADPSVGARLARQLEIEDPAGAGVLLDEPEQVPERPWWKRFGRSIEQPVPNVEGLHDPSVRVLARPLRATPDVPGAREVLLASIAGRREAWMSPAEALDALALSEDPPVDVIESLLEEVSGAIDGTVAAALGRVVVASAARADALGSERRFDTLLRAAERGDAVSVAVLTELRGGGLQPDVTRAVARAGLRSGALRPGVAAADLLAHLSDGDAAGSVLGLLQAAVDGRGGQVHHEDLTTLAVAARSLLPEDSKHLVALRDLLVHATTSDDVTVAARAVHAIAEVGGKSALGAITDALDSPSRSVDERMALVRSLGLVADPVVDDVLLLVEDAGRTSEPDHASAKLAEAAGATRSARSHRADRVDGADEARLRGWLAGAAGDPQPPLDLLAALAPEAREAVLARAADALRVPWEARGAGVDAARASALLAGAGAFAELDRADVVGGAWTSSRGDGLGPATIRVPAAASFDVTVASPELDADVTGRNRRAVDELNGDVPATPVAFGRLDAAALRGGDEVAGLEQARGPEGPLDL